MSRKSFGVVLVHGTGADAQTTWGDVVPWFTDRRTVTLPDLVCDSELTVEGLAEQVATHIDDAPVDVVGFSMGAVVAAAVAALHPDLVRRLVLIGGWAFRDEYIHNLMTVWRSLAHDPDAFGRYAAITAFSPAYLNGLTPDDAATLVKVVKPTPATLHQINLNLRLDIRSLLPLIRAETLTIGCTLDHTIPVENARALHAAIPHSTYAELNCGHVAHAERPDELRALITNHIDS